MTVRQTLDPADLLAACSGGGAGEDPRMDMSPSSPYLHMKDARSTARRKERALDIDADSPSPAADWADVAERGCTILAEKGKDLEVAAWLIEALLRVDGIAGLLTGVQVAEGLISAYWEVAFPLPDEDGFEGRLSPFIALNGSGGDGTLIQALRKVPLTAGETAFGFWQYEQAQATDSIGDSTRREARINDGALTMDRFLEAVVGTPRSFYVDLLDEIAAAREALDSLSAAFTVQVGRDAPPASALRGILQDIESAVRAFASDKLRAAADDVSAIDDVGIDAEDPAPKASEDAEVSTSASGKVLSREEAFRRLLKIAAFFRQTEPHSPISYSLEEIVRRGRLSLPELLNELIMDADARRFFFIASGVRPAEDVG